MFYRKLLSKNLTVGTVRLLSGILLGGVFIEPTWGMEPIDESKKPKKPKFSVLKSKSKKSVPNSEPESEIKLNTSDSKPKAAEPQKSASVESKSKQRSQSLWSRAPKTDFQARSRSLSPRDESKRSTFSGAEPKPLELTKSITCSRELMHLDTPNPGCTYTALIIDIPPQDITQDVPPSLNMIAYPALTTLEINNFDVSRFSGLSKGLRGKVLKTLRLMGCHITDESEKLLKTIGSLPCLQKLWLKQNQIGSKGLQALLEGLKIKCFSNGVPLTLLYLESNQLGGEGAKRLASAMEPLPKEMVEGNEVSFEVGSLCALESLNVGCNQISDEEFFAFAKILGVNSSLKELHANGNKITNVGVEYFKNPLKNNRTLETFNLSNNNITAGGAKTFEEILKENPILRNINLGGNQISGEGVLSFLNMLFSLSFTRSNFILDMDNNTLEYINNYQICIINPEDRDQLGLEILGVYHIKNKLYCTTWDKQPILLYEGLGELTYPEDSEDGRYVKLLERTLERMKNSYSWIPEDDEKLLLQYVSLMDYIPRLDGRINSKVAKEKLKDKGIHVSFTPRAPRFPLEDN